MGGSRCSQRTFPEGGATSRVPDNDPRPAKRHFMMDVYCANSRCAVPAASARFILAAIYEGRVDRCWDCAECLHQSSILCDTKIKNKSIVFFTFLFCKIPV